MAPGFLSVDLGNSRCKLRCTEGPDPLHARIVAPVEFDTRAGLHFEVEQWLSKATLEIAGAAMSSVAASELEDALAAVLTKQLGARFVRGLECGLVIRCTEPERVGRDRLFAARGALALVRGSALVIDAGTALTVDALSAERVAQAAFLGGAIAPGPRLLARALSSGTARLFEVEPVPGARALGRDTREALAAGVAVGFAGAARELVLRVGAEAGLERAPVVLTGGARAFLLQPSIFAARTVRTEPELVHLGLFSAWHASRT